MSKLYLDSGYTDPDELLNSPAAWTWACGGRGIGKTYGVLRALIEKRKKFILMRKTQTMADAISAPALSPFKPIITDTDISIRYRSEQGFKIAYRTDGEAGPEDFCIIVALSTLSTRRGIDATDYEYLVYDEFISEQHENIRIKDEFRAFNNAYETLNRNRELQGKPALKVIALANAFDLANPYFLGMKIVTPVYRMLQNDQQSLYMPERDLKVIVYQDSPISKRKADTVLYRVNAGSDFNDFALGNQFVYDDRLNIKSMNLKEFRAIVAVGELAIYRHKTKKLFYVTGFQGGIKPYYETRPSDLIRFVRKYLYIYDLLYTDCIVFEKYEYQRLFQIYCS